MRQRISTLLLIGLLLRGAGVPSASAAWIWSPQTGWVGPSGAVKDTPGEQLTFALSFFEQQDYDRARTEFRKLLRAYKDSKEAPEAQYYLGRVEEADADYYRAFLEYRKTIQTYPSTSRVEEILQREYQVGNYFFEGKKRKLFGRVAILPARDKAVEIFQAIAEDGPFSEHGQLAQYKLGMAHLALKDYEPAVTAFERLISRYPDSPLIDDARFQIAVASLKGTFKPGYDQSPTELAIKELHAFLRTYAAGELADDARTRLGELQEQRAQHEFQVAQFYERRRHPASARIYYETIVGRYAGTSWAAKAAERLHVLAPHI